MKETFRFVEGSTVMHIKETDDETHCGQEAGDTLVRISTGGIHQVGLVRGKEVCESCRDSVAEDG